MQEKYEKLEVEIIIFDTEDAIVTSGDENEGPLNPDF